MRIIPKQAYYIRSYMGTPDRIAMGIIATMCSSMAVASILANQTPFLTYLMTPINTALGVWGFFCAYRPRKAKQERVIATALLLGMDAAPAYCEDDIKAGAKQRYRAATPSNHDEFYLIRTVAGRTMYDVAALWLMEMGY
jgi:hypothetical protein